MRTTGGVNRAHEIVSLRTELHEAARTGRLQLVALLIKQGALLEAADEDGLTPLHEAVRAGHADVVELLLGQGAQVDARSRSGQTALHMAAEQSHLDVMETLVKRGAELQAVDHSGRTPVDVATENDQSEMAVWLEGAIAAKGPAKKAKHFKFYPFPALLRWPTVPLFICVCCLTGLLHSAFAGFTTCSGRFVTIVPLAIVLAVLVLMWTQLLVFHRRHRRAMWRSGKQQQQEQQQQDGDKASVRAWRRLSKMQQPRGEFIKDESEALEPARTERALAHPLRFFPVHAADAHESVAVNVLFKCRGDAKHAMAYHMGKLTAQLAVAALAGAGAALAEGSPEASGLMTIVLAIQISVFAWIVCCRPSIDIMDRLVHAVSWGAESGTTALLLIYSGTEESGRRLDESSGGALATIALMLALLGMALPTVKLVCDCLLARLYRLVLRCVGSEQIEDVQEVDVRDRKEQGLDVNVVAANGALPDARPSADPDQDRLRERLAALEQILAAAPAPGPARAKPSLKAAIRTVQTAQHMERKLTRQRQGLLEGRHAPLPAGPPPANVIDCRDSTGPFGQASMSNLAAVAAAASSTAVPERAKPSLKAAIRTVQTAQHMDRKLTRKRQGLREGRHVPLPAGLPDGPPPQNGGRVSPDHQPGRIALRRARQAQSFDRSLTKPTPRARVSDTSPVPTRRTSSFPIRRDQPINFDKHQVAFARVEMQTRQAEESGVRRSRPSTPTMSNPSQNFLFTL